MKRVLIITLLLSSYVLIGCKESKTNDTSEPTQQTTNQESETTENLTEATDSSTDAPKTFKFAQVRPSNDARRDESLKIFLEDLVNTLETKDVAALLEVVSPDIKIGFGGSDGIENFKSTWKLDQDAASSKLWTTLKNIIEAGGSFDKNNRSVYTVPYYYTNFPKDYDPFVYSVVIGNNVNVRAVPNRGAKTIRQLHHDVVIELQEEAHKIVEERIGGELHPWRRIRMADGQEGYVFGKYVKSPITYRASFEKLPNEGWQLYSLMSGD